MSDHEMEKALTREAKCMCGNLNLECTGEPTSVSLCNCLECQRRTGSAFGVAAFFDKENIRVAGKASCYSPTTKSGFDFSFYFCPSCGATVYWETTRKQEYVVVAGGAFADPDFPAPTQSVFEEHKHPWVGFSI